MDSVNKSGYDDLLGQFLTLFLSLINGFQNLITSLYGWLYEFLPTTQFLDKTDILDLTLVPLKGTID